MPKARIIVGCNYGDEGKGTVTAYYAKRCKGTPLNILTNGGAQRGHSVVTDKGDFTFHHFGSGTVFWAANCFSEFFILNPMLFAKEHGELSSRLELKTIHRHRHCMWTTPFDQMFNYSIEKARGNANHGSCGMGIWETVLRYRNGISMDFDNFMAIPHEMKLAFLNRVKKYFEFRNPYLIHKDLLDAWNSPMLVEHFINDCSYLYENTVPVTDMGMLLNWYDDLLLENGQGLLLNSDPDNVHTTPSRTGVDDANEILAGMGVALEDISIHFVTRPYMTRHGQGPFDTELGRESISASVNEDRTNHFNEMQGNFRYGTLDIECLKHRINAEGAKIKGAEKHIEITHCDEMDRVSEFHKFFENIHLYDSPSI